MLSLLFSLLIGWLLLRWLMPRTPICIAPPTTITIHLHQPRIVVQLNPP